MVRRRLRARGPIGENEKKKKGGQGSEGRPGGLAEETANRSSRAKTPKRRWTRKKAEQSRIQHVPESQQAVEVYTSFSLQCRRGCEICFQKVKIASARSKVHARGNPLLNGNQGEWVGIGEG